MSALELTFDGTLYDKMTKSSRQVTLIGQAFYTGLGVGGGPAPGGPPLGFWGGVAPPYPDQGLPGDQPHPDHGLPGQPPYPSQGPGFPTNPIVIPPPNMPNVPPPGSPPVIVEGTQPTNPMVPPQAVIIEYPGVGKVIVPLPTA